MTIYDKFDDVILEVAVDDESHRYREICGEQYVRLQFSLAEHKDIPVGSYIVIDSERYTLLDPQNIKMQHTREYEYVVIFDAEQAKLKLYRFYNIVDKRLQFPLTAKPHEHLQMLVDVLALRDGAWAMGDCIEGEEVAISYNRLSCYEALELMAQTLNTEWEVVGNTISLHKVAYNQYSPLALSYGEGNGFVSGVSRTNYGDNKPLAVVYTQGGERNIDPSKYGSSTLLLPKSKTIKYDGSKFEGELGYNDTKAVEYASNIYGTAVARVTPNGNIAEGSVDCTEIYPKRESEVTEVVVADATKNLYDIVDSTIPESLNFEDYRIEGEKMFVAFQTGMLAGKEFEAIYKHTAIGFNKARRFEIVPQVIDGQTMPGGAYIPAVGDKYAVLGIALPDAYIADDATKTGASWDMMHKAVRYLAENECPQFTFSGTLDKIWAKRNWENIAPYMRCGAHIAFTNEAYQPTPMNVRVESIKEFINNPHAPELGLSDKTVKATMRLDAMLHNSQFAIANATTRNDALRRSVIIKNDLAALSNLTAERDEAFQEWKKEQEEALEGVEASAAIKIFKQQLAEIEAEFASIEGIVATLIVKPAEWLLYLDAYKVYSAKLKEVLKLKNPDSIDVSGFDEARATYIDTRDKLKKAINYQDALASQVALYRKEIVSVESQREAILQEWANLLGKLWVLADSTGAGLVDKDGVALYVYDSAGETTTEYERYSASANAYISMLRAMIAALDFNENDEYKQLRKDYYREYSLIKTMISQGRVNRFDSIDVTLGGYNDKITQSQRLSAIAIVTANKTWISGDVGSAIMRSSLLDTLEGVTIEKDAYAAIYPENVSPPEYYEYKQAAYDFAVMLKGILSTTSGKTWNVTPEFVSMRNTYLDARDALREYELTKQ